MTFEQEGSHAVALEADGTDDPHDGKAGLNDGEAEGELRPDAVAVEVHQVKAD